MDGFLVWTVGPSGRDPMPVRLPVNESPLSVDGLLMRVGFPSKVWLLEGMSVEALVFLVREMALLDGLSMEAVAGKASHWRHTTTS